MAIEGILLIGGLILSALCWIKPAALPWMAIVAGAGIMALGRPVGVAMIGGGVIVLLFGLASEKRGLKAAFVAAVILLAACALIVGAVMTGG